MQALVSERMAMTAANVEREIQGKALAYGEEAFALNAAALRQILPDPHQFA